MAVVTISRELGSNGTRIAEAVALGLDASCVNKEVLAEMARQAGVSVDVIVHAEERLAARPMLVSPEMRSLFGGARKQESSSMDEAQFIQKMSGAIRTLADQDNIVFVGRGSQLILADRPQVLHVHLYAVLEVRARRIQSRRQLPDLEVAMRLVQQADEQRRSWFRRFFTGADWQHPRHYHLMIDTGRIPEELAVSVIVRAAQAPGVAGEGPGS